MTRRNLRGPFVVLSGLLWPLAFGGSARAADLDPMPAPLEPASFVGAAACTLRANDYIGSVSLELSPGLAYASVWGADKIEMVLGVAGPATVRLDAGGVQLVGVTSGAASPLHPARAFLVNEMAVPGYDVYLRWKVVGVDAVEVAILSWHIVHAASTDPLPKGAEQMVFSTTRPLSARVRCTDLTLDRKPWDPFTAVGGYGLDGWARLRRGPPVWLSVRPDGPKVGELPVYPSARTEVRVLARGNGWTRIGLQEKWGLAHYTGDDLRGVLIVGWVLESRLRLLPWTGSRAEGAIGLVGRGSAPASRAPKPFACKKRIALAASAGGQLRTVGSVGPLVPLFPDGAPPAGGLVGVRFGEHARLRAEEGARFLVRLADVESCSGYPGKP